MRQYAGLTLCYESINDPDGLGNYTLKRWESEKVVETDESGQPWRHEKITLHPANKTYSPIVLGQTSGISVRVVAEFLRILTVKA